MWESNENRQCINFTVHAVHTAIWICRSSIFRVAAAHFVTAYHSNRTNMTTNAAFEAEKNFENQIMPQMQDRFGRRLRERESEMDLILTQTSIGLVGPSNKNPNEMYAVMTADSTNKFYHTASHRLFAGVSRFYFISHNAFQFDWPVLIMMCQL